MDHSTWAVDAAWSDVPSLSPFLLADGSGPASRATRVRLCADPDALWIRFDSDDDDPFATLTGRDEPLWTEDVVEVFLAPGDAPPETYYEFEVNPLGALFDARVHNPNSRREDMLVDPRWDCDGVAWGAGVDRVHAAWWATLRVPWSSLGAGSRARTWRANFFRIDRRRGEPPEYAAWSPTWAIPADFHKPSCFGTLLVDSARAEP